MRHPFHRKPRPPKPEETAVNSSGTPVRSFTTSRPSATPQPSISTETETTEWDDVDWARKREARLKPERDARWARIRENRTTIDTEICGILESRYGPYSRACIDEYRTFQKSRAKDPTTDFGWQDLSTSWLASRLTYHTEDYHNYLFTPTEESPTPISGYIREASERADDHYARCVPEIGEQGTGRMARDYSGLCLTWQDATGDDLKVLAKLEPSRMCTAFDLPRIETDRNYSTVEGPLSETAYTGPVSPVPFAPHQLSSTQTPETGTSQFPDRKVSSPSASGFGFGTASLCAVAATVTTAAVYQAYRWCADELGGWEEESSVQAFSID